MNRSFLISSLIAVTLLSTACSIITLPVRILTLNTGDVPSAQCLITDRQGNQWNVARTPESVDLSNAQLPIEINCSKEGYLPSKVVLNHLPQRQHIELALSTYPNPYVRQQINPSAVNPYHPNPYRQNLQAQPFMPPLTSQPFISTDYSSTASLFRPKQDPIYHTNNNVPLSAYLKQHHSYSSTRPFSDARLSKKLKNEAHFPMVSEYEDDEDQSDPPQINN